VSDCVQFSITTVCFSWSKVNELNFQIDWEVQDWLLKNKRGTSNKDVGIAKQQKIGRQKLLKHYSCMQPQSAIFTTGGFALGSKVKSHYIIEHNVSSSLWKNSNYISRNCWQRIVQETLA